MLHGDKVSFTQAADGIIVTIDPNAMEAPSTIVVLDLDRSAETLAPVGDVPLNHGVKVTSSNADPATDRFACDGAMHTAWQADTGTKQPSIPFTPGTETTNPPSTPVHRGY